MRRGAFVFAVSVLAIASMTLAWASASIGRTPSTVSNGAADARIVDRYYALVNSAIATGDTGPLSSLLSTEFRDLSVPSAGSDADAFTDYVSWLGATAPDTEVTPIRISRSPEEFLIQLDVSTSQNALPGGIAMTTSHTLWPPFEVLTVQSGQILKRETVSSWSQPPKIVWTYTHEALPSPETSLQGSRYTFNGITGARFTAGRGPAVFVVEHGELTLSLGASTDEFARIHVSRSGKERDPVLVAPGTAVAIDAGAVIIVPPRAGFSLLHLRREQASALSVAADLTSFIADDDQTQSAPDSPGVTEDIVSTHSVGNFTFT
ncbi:MAG: hypothetical protein AB7G88_04225, partial [Thermomicrobiales bacterium]